MKTIDLLFVPKDPEHSLSHPVARIVLGDHAYDDENRYLSCECVTAEEVESQVNYLKRKLDEVAASARRKFKAN